MTAYTPNEMMNRRVDYIKNELDEADTALWHVMSNMDEIKKGRGRYSEMYAEALIKLVATARIAVHELRESVDSELQDLVSEDFPTEGQE